MRPILAVLAILEPVPAREKAILVGKLIMDPVGECFVKPVVRLRGVHIILERLQIGARRWIVGIRQELDVVLIRGIYDAVCGTMFPGNGERAE